MKRINMNKKGITLIALVITIVVLIILAAVAINLSLGNNGIFNRAKIGKELYQNAEEYESVEISKAKNEIDTYTSFSRSGGSSLSYLTTEQDTGIKYLDGKEIYQITLTGTTTTSSYLDVPHNIPNFNRCIDIEGYVVEGNYHVPVGFYNGTQYFSAFVTSTNLCLRYYSTYNNSTYYITLRYTKTS